jgi:hypothetical protein
MAERAGSPEVGDGPGTILRYLVRRAARFRRVTGKVERRALAILNAPGDWIGPGPDGSPVLYVESDPDMPNEARRIRAFVDDGMAAWDRANPAPDARESITSYLAVMELIQDGWDRSCRRRAEIRRRDPDADPSYGKDFRRLGLLREGCEHIHFPGIDPRTGAGIVSEARLWRWIEHSLFLLVNRGSGYTLGDPLSFQKDMMTAYGHMVFLDVTGVPDRPYPRMTEQECRDELKTIANRLRNRESERHSAARPMPDPTLSAQRADSLPDAEPFLCSKSELLRALGKDETTTAFLDSLVSAGKLRLEPATRRVGHWRYNAVFTDRDEHRRVRDLIERERRGD